MSRADHAGNRAAAFIVAQEEGGWTDADQIEFDAWLAEDDGNKAAYWRLKHSWREADRIRSLGLAANRVDHDVVRPPARRWQVAAALAASIAAMVGTGYSVWQLAPPLQGTAIAYDTPVGGRKIVNLADGSRVQLNTASVVRTAVTDSQREVWLDRGEAFFEITHDGRPFVVHAGNRQITVLGTKFSVRRDHDRVTVSVLEGRVRVDEIDGRRDIRSATLSGGDIALALGDATLVTTRSEQRVESTLAWRDGMLSFDQKTSLSDVAAEFNRYNSRVMIVTDSAAGNLRIGGLFPASQPDAFARLLRDAYGLKVVETADAIRISS